MLLRGALLISSVLAGATVITADASAQSTNAPTRDELDIKRLPTVTPRDSRLTVEGDIERAPCPLADPQFANVAVNFSAVEFNNLKGLSPTALDASWREFAGRSIPVAQLCEIRDHAATILRKEGYLAAVQVVPQRIAAGGTVQFDVLMAKLVRLQVRGDAGPSERKIVQFLEPLTGQEVFNAKQAERAMLLARDLPGYDVRLTLRPAGTVPGEVIGEVAVTYQRFEVEANVQNLGSPDTGRFGGFVGARLNGLTGLGDQTTLSLYNTIDFSEQTILQGGHSFLIGGNGLRLSGDVTYAWTSPELNPPAPIKSETLVATMNLSYPVIRLQSRNLLASVGFDLVDQNIRFGAVPLTADKLRILYARADFDQTDPSSLASQTGYSAAEPRWRYGGNIELRQGLSILGASRSCGAGFVNCLPPFTPLSRIEADPTAFVSRAQAYAEFRPAPNVTLVWEVRGQYAAKPLSSFEEFSAGNYTIGRGYDAGALLGDSGIGTRNELRLFKLQPKSRNHFAVQPFAFFDASRVWNEDRLAPPYVAGRSDLYSAGGGVNIAWGNKARLSLYAAAPLKTSGLLNRKGDVRLLMTLTAKLVPWSR
jgi:hemolysin activation/secretion protein